MKAPTRDVRLFKTVTSRRCIIATHSLISPANWILRMDVWGTDTYK